MTTLGTPHQLRDSLALYTLVCASPPLVQTLLLACEAAACALPYCRGPQGVTPPALLPLLAGLAAELLQRRLPGFTAAWALPARSLALSLAAAALAVPDPARLVSCATTCAVLHAVLRRAGLYLGSAPSLSPNTSLPPLFLCVCATALRLLRAWHQPPLSTQSVLDAFAQRESARSPHFSQAVTALDTYAGGDDSDAANANTGTTALYKLGVQLDGAAAAAAQGDCAGVRDNRRTFLWRLFSGAYATGGPAAPGSTGTAALAPLWAAAIAAKVCLGLDARGAGAKSTGGKSGEQPPGASCTDLAQLNLPPVQAGGGVLSPTPPPPRAQEPSGSYAVCVVDIAAHAITFHIRNLVAGELIVLVNGLIWSEVACTLVMERVGEEYVVVSGLVPASAYDIQFVNRLDGGASDWVCADLAVRTGGENSTGGDSSPSPEPAPFPSYYHRTFRSPLLTLQHSVLTTNTNLADERQKVKRTRKEISKKTAALRAELASVRARLAQSGAAEEQGGARIETLKLQVAQSEARVAEREARLQAATAELAARDDAYRGAKDRHLKLELELGKLREPLRAQLHRLTERGGRAANERAGLEARLARLEQRHATLQRQWQEQEEALGRFRAQFTQHRERARARRLEHRQRETNDLELECKALEQDVSRLEFENEGMRGGLAA